MAPLFFFLTLLSLALALSLPTSNNATHSLQKRYFSVDPNDRHEGIWPLVKDDKVKGAHRPVYYCFENAQAARNLAPILQAAIHKWAPATQVSSLSFEPHPETGDNPLQPKKFCDDLPHPVDALVIRDMGPRGGSPSSSTGYDHVSKQHLRHYIKFFGVGEGSDQSRDELVASMTHELGHVVGLGHEHQRPDRDRFIHFRAYNLQGWFQATNRIRGWEGNQFPKTARLNKEARYEALATDMVVAEKFDLNVLSDYLPGMVGGEPATSFRHGGPMDFNSIMIYGSYQSKGEDTPESSEGGSSEEYSSSSDADSNNSGHAGGSSSQPRPKLTYEQRKMKTAVILGFRGKTEFEIHQGGSENAAARRLSPGDIARIRALYPKN